jgi:hypothetical protein
MFSKLFSDEAWFHLSQKIGVWLAVSRRRIIEPIFFNQTITSARYRSDLSEPFLNELHGDELTKGIFSKIMQMTLDCLFERIV